MALRITFFPIGMRNSLIHMYHSASYLPILYRCLKPGPAFYHKLFLWIEPGPYPLPSFPFPEPSYWQGFIKNMRLNHIAHTMNVYPMCVFGARKIRFKISLCVALQPVHTCQPATVRIKGSWNIACHFFDGESMRQVKSEADVGCGQCHINFSFW